LISNIHARGTKPEDAAVRILNLVAQMMHAGASGYDVREEPATRIGK
jgi:ethanolamine ammonia-lyase small subunit